MTLAEQMRERRAALKAELVALNETVAGESRTALTDEESAKFDKLMSDIAAADKRSTELDELEVREAASAETRKLAGQSGEQTGTAKVTEPPVYNPEARESYFKDLFFAQHKGDRDAYDRLRRNTAIETEKRALGNTGGVGGSGGEFAPPIWLVNEYIALARPARVAADLFDKQALPHGLASVNLPRIATGTTVATQTTQNTALSQTDMTTTSLSSGVSTLGGKQVVSLQLLEQSAIPFDRIIMEDLALAYAGALDVQALTGAGTSGALRGLASAAGLTSVPFTQTAPTVGGAGQFYATVAKAIAQVYSTRYLAPDTILMHPRRWAWITAAFDTQNRPLVVPTAVAVNPIATDESNVPQGGVGQLQGLAVYTDPNVPINTGVGVNQDPVYVFRRGDIKLWEGTPRAESFNATYADSAGVLFRLYNYAAMIPDRYGSSIVVVNGTGTVTPVF